MIEVRCRGTEEGVLIGRVQGAGRRDIGLGLEGFGVSVAVCGNAWERDVP